MENHYYLASANTCHGFINHFNYINPNENGMTYILKGGPGTGKSSFMKKVGEYFSKKGFTIEYFFCSSDSDSLDGVRIVEKNVAIVDGTAPHVTEATIPGVKEKIVNLGSFINGKIKKHKDTIEDLLAKKSACFSVAYAYLKTLGELLKIEKMLRDSSQKSKSAFDITSILPILKNSNKGSQRKLFLSYYLVEKISSLQEKNNFKHIINLDSTNYFEGCDKLKEISSMLEKSHIEFTSFMSVLDPDDIESIYIPSLSTLVINNKAKQKFLNEKLINALIKKSAYYISKAKQYHKKVEKFYVENMDFKGIDSIREEIIKEIEQL